MMARRPDSVHFPSNLPGHLFSDQHQPDIGISPALAQQVPGLGGGVCGGAPNPGQGEG